MLPDEPGIDHHIAGEKPGLSEGNLPPAGIASIFPDRHGKYKQ